MMPLGETDASGNPASARATKSKSAARSGGRVTAKPKVTPNNGAATNKKPRLQNTPRATKAGKNRQTRALVRPRHTSP
jgi:hypothetical protein